MLCGDYIFIGAHMAENIDECGLRSLGEVFFGSSEFCFFLGGDLGALEIITIDQLLYFVIGPRRNVRQCPRS